MGSFIQKLERKCHGKGIPNLPIVIIVFYAVGYFLQVAMPGFGGNYGISAVLSLNPDAILHGQVWRLVTWLLIPPQMSSLIFVIIMLIFYLSISRQLERVWGSFYFTYYICSGIVFTIIGSFVVYGLCKVLPDYKSLELYVNLMNPKITWLEGGNVFYYSISMEFTTYYIVMSLFLAFAATFPNNIIMLYFIIPIKVKWLGIFYAGILIYEIISSISSTSIPGWWIIKLVIFLSSILNFLVFYFTSLRIFGRIKQAKRKREYVQRVEPVRHQTSRHKCAICGRTSEEYPSLEFRFCSKCVGSYEYCNDHLFSHQHVTGYSGGPEDDGSGYRRY